MATRVKSPARRPRHDPRETEREILEAAEELLREHPVREMTVEQVMARTGLKRPAFYAHFQDRHDLILRVVGDIGERLFAMADRWLQGDDPEPDVVAAIEGVAEVYLTDGPVLRALADAAGADERVEEAYHGLVQAFVDATAEHIRSEQATGRTAGDLDPHETARALVWLNERYLSEAFGRPPQGDPAKVVGVLSRIWLATLYGAGGPARPA
jgi:TetR/AcrR family transcriptional regulator, ethionamide resistance regulator